MFKLAICFTLFTALLAADGSVNHTTGDEILVMGDWSGSAFEIRACIQIAGVYSAVSVISSPLVSPHDPVGSINASDQAVAIWRGNDTVTGNQSLYAASYNGTWSSPVLLSVPLVENVSLQYDVTVADNGAVVITWKASLLSTKVTVTRVMYSSTFGTWTTPVTVL